MSKLSPTDKSFLQLILRSPDLGEGWRNVSNALWRFVEEFSAQELLDRDGNLKRVRLSEKGKVIADYLL